MDSLQGDKPARPDHEVFQTVCRLLWGSHPGWWRLAQEALDLSGDRELRRWWNGTRPIPDGIWHDVQTAMHNRIWRLGKVSSEIGAIRGRVPEETR